MLKKKYIDTRSLTIIFLISLIYGLIVKAGFVGFGIDYYAAYNKQNLEGTSIRDAIGWKISTLYIFDIYLGTFLVPFFISFTTGILLKHFFKIQLLNSSIIFLLIFIMSIFSWPIVISSNNAMRQGLMMAAIFLSLVSLSNGKLILAIFYMTIASFTHKSGVGYMLNLLYLIGFVLFLEKNFTINRLSFIFLGLVYFIVFYVVCMSVDRYGSRFGTNVPIGKDFSSLFMLINLFYILYFTTRIYLLKNYLFLFLYFFSFSCLAVFSAGLYWEFERYNMSLITVYICTFSFAIKYNSKYVYFITTLATLFILTFLTGMYDHGGGVWSKELIYKDMIMHSME
jgi:hypothetical protein